MIIITLILFECWVYTCTQKTVERRAVKRWNIQTLKCSTYEIVGSLLLSVCVYIIQTKKKIDNFNKRWTFSAVSLFPWLCVFWSRKCLENNLNFDLNIVERFVFRFV